MYGGGTDLQTGCRPLPSTDVHFPEPTVSRPHPLPDPELGPGVRVSGSPPLPGYRVSNSVTALGVSVAVDRAVGSECRGHPESTPPDFGREGRTWDSYPSLCPSHRMLRLPQLGSDPLPSHSGRSDLDSSVPGVLRVGSILGRDPSPTPTHGSRTTLPPPPNSRPGPRVGPTSPPPRCRTSKRDTETVVHCTLT